MSNSLESHSTSERHRWLGSHLDFQETWKFQQDYVAEVIAGEKEECFFHLEHSPVYTIGRTRDQSSLNKNEHLPHPVVEINRGGQATYHGPGQLVVYPILNLNNYGKDLHLYVRALEQALIDTCAVFELKATRREGLTGVWVENRKLASIGVGVKKWISMHGLAINITKQSLPSFFAITPCGIDNVSMTSVSSELAKNISVKDFSKALEEKLESAISALQV